MRRLRPWLVLLLLLSAAPLAGAGAAGERAWDPVEPVRWSGFQGENLLQDPRFERMGDAWNAIFTDVGEGEATVEDGVLRLVVPRAAASGAAYAEAWADVVPGRAYHLAFEARLLGDASEVAALVLPEGGEGGEELVVRGNPRANAWGLGGEWTAPPGATRAKVLLRFMITEGAAGGAAFAAPHFAEGPAPAPRVGLQPPPWLLPPGRHPVSAGNETFPLVVEEVPPPRVLGDRFVPVGERPAFTLETPPQARVELLPTTRFDPFRGWWSLDARGHPATLDLARGNATLHVEPRPEEATVSIAGVLEDPRGHAWRLELDGALPEGVRGQVFLRERQFPPVPGLTVDYLESSRYVEGEGPWTLHAPRQHPHSRRLEVILAFTFPAGVGGDVTLRASSLTLEGELERGKPVTGARAATPGLQEVRVPVQDAFNRSVVVQAEYWAGEPPRVCQGEPRLAAWLPPGDEGFWWEDASGRREPVDASPRFRFDERVLLVRDGEAWWNATARTEPAPLPEVRVPRGGEATVALPCSAGLSPDVPGVRVSEDGGRATFDAAWWRLPTTRTLVDAEGREVAVLRVVEPGGALAVVAVGALALVAWGVVAWRRRR